MAENVQKLKYQNLDIYTQEQSIVSIVKTQTTQEVRLDLKSWSVIWSVTRGAFTIDSSRLTLRRYLSEHSIQDVNPGDIAVSEKKISILLPVRGLRTLFLRCARACKLTTSGKSSILSSLEKSIWRQSSKNIFQLTE
jgi:hypothetical protein